jgi:DNA polymerase-3 subunit alpha
VNESGWKFTPVSGETIRFGLGALRGLGAAAVSSILENRAREGAYTSLFNLVDRVDLRQVGKRSLEALILAGACDQFTSPPAHRAQLMEGLETAIREAQLRAEERDSGQASLFDLGGAPELVQRTDPQLPDVPRWTESERLTREKEILGFFISGHPLERYRDEVRVFEQVNTAVLKQFRDQKIELACVVTAVQRQISKKNGSEWGRITVEDFYGTASVLAFGDVWEHYHDLLTQDAAVLIRGVVSGRDRDEDAPPIFLDSVVALSQLRSNGTLAIEVALADAAADAVSRAAAAFRAHPGSSPLYVTVTHGGNGVRETVRLRSRSLQVLPSETLVSELRELFGAERIRLVRS